MKKEFKFLTAIFTCISIFLSTGTVSAKSQIKKLMDDCGAHYDYDYANCYYEGMNQTHCYLDSDNVKDQIDTDVIYLDDLGNLPPVKKVGIAINRDYFYWERNLSGAQFTSLYLMDFSKNRRYLALVGDQEDSELACIKVYKYNKKTYKLSCVNNFGHDLVSQLGQYQNYSFGKTTSNGFILNGHIHPNTTGTLTVSYYINTKKDHFTFSRYGKACFYGNKSMTTKKSLSLYNAPNSKKITGVIGRNQKVKATAIYGKRKKVWVRFKSGNKTGWKLVSGNKNYNWFKNVKFYAVD